MNDTFNDNYNSNRFLDKADNYGVPILFQVLAIMLLVSSIFGVLANANYQFQGTQTLLDMLFNAPVVDMSTSGLFIEKITEEWIGFNWFRDFLNLFIGLFNIIIFTSTNLYNIVAYIVYFLTGFFRFA